MPTWTILLVLACAALGPPARGAEDPGVQALRQNQLQRQQQQDALQLRMQQQSGAQAARNDARERAALEQLQSGQRQQLDRLHYRQAIGAAIVHPGDDEGTRRAKIHLDLEKARQESLRQLRGAEALEQKK